MVVSRDKPLSDNSSKITKPTNMPREKLLMMTLQIKTMAVEMEDRVILFSFQILQPTLFSNTFLKSWGTAHNDTDIHMAPTI
jgi:hypothetical protein